MFKTPRFFLKSLKFCYGKVIYFHYVTNKLKVYSILISNTYPTPKNASHYPLFTESDNFIIWSTIRSNLSHAFPWLWKKHKISFSYFTCYIIAQFMHYVNQRTWILLYYYNQNVIYRLLLCIFLVYVLQNINCNFQFTIRKPDIVNFFCSYN